jgi:ABC-type transporter Mla subunit MlaD
MTEKVKTWIYTLVIILIFLLLGFIVWLVYDYQIHQLDHEQEEIVPGSVSPGKP